MKEYSGSVEKPNNLERVEDFMINNVLIRGYVKMLRVMFSHTGFVL